VTEKNSFASKREQVMANMNSRLGTWWNIGVSALVLSAFLITSTALRADGQDKTKPVTFSKDIAPILQEKCQDCHRPGQIAPMSLLTYQDARPWARDIKMRVLQRSMPPWFLDKTVGIQHFANDLSLSDEQIATIVKWVDAGAPQGDPLDMPPAKVWPADDGWKLAKVFGRQPDLVLNGPDYTMKANYQDQWDRPISDVSVAEPRWVRAVEMRPSNPEPTGFTATCGNTCGTMSSMQTSISIMLPIRRRRNIARICLEAQ